MRNSKILNLQISGNRSNIIITYNVTIIMVI